MIQHPKKFLHTHQVFQLGGKQHFWNRLLPSSKVLKEKQDLEFHCHPRDTIWQKWHMQATAKHAQEMFLHTLIPVSRLLPNCLLISRCPCPSAPFLHFFKPVQAKSICCCLQVFRSVLCSSVLRDLRLNLQTSDKLKGIWLFPFEWISQSGATEKPCGSSSEPQKRSHLWVPLNSSTS